MAASAATLPPLPANPLLFQIRATVLLSQFVAVRGEGVGSDAPAADRKTSLDKTSLASVPPSWFASLRSLGFDIVYLLEHVVSPRFGGDAALREFVARAHTVGLRVMLDYVPNHTATDHGWVTSRPHLYVRGTVTDAARAPSRYFVVHPPGPDEPVAASDGFGRGSGVSIRYGSASCGEDGWADTAQLDYRNPDTREAMMAVLESIVSKGLADGVRCDMAMLVLNEAIERNWGSVDRQPEFWAQAISRVRAIAPQFVFIAEVYGESAPWQLQQLGFDFTYDKRLYDRLHSGDASGVMEHLRAGSAYQRKCVRFTENHDEPRAITVHPHKLRGAQAAAVIAMTVPGLHFLHDGQQSGRSIHHSMHVGPRAREPCSVDMLVFYRRLMHVLAQPEFKSGHWHLAAVSPSKDMNPTWRNVVAALVTTRSDGIHVRAERAAPSQPSVAAMSTTASSTSSVESAPVVFAHSSTQSVGSISGCKPPSQADRLDAVASHMAAGSVGSENSLLSSTTTSTATGSPVAPLMRSLPLQPEAGLISAPQPMPAPFPVSTASTNITAAGIANGIVDFVRLPMTTLGPDHRADMPAPTPATVGPAFRAFLVLVNNSGATADGHVMLTRADDAMYHDGAFLNSVQHWIAALHHVLSRPTSCDSWGQPSLAGRMTEVAATDTGAPRGGAAAAYSGPTLSARQAYGRRVVFVDWLSSYVKEYPLDAVLEEGWWVQLEPWSRHVFEIVFPQDE